MTKVELRKEYLQKRKNLSAQAYTEANQSLCDSFFSNFDLSTTRVLHTFLPILANKEPDTWLIMDRIKKEYPTIRFSIPLINKASDQLEHYYFEGLDQLQENSWGIKQPKKGQRCEPSEIDIVLVPLLTFDLSGQRVGYGKGYYDRFLSSCRPDCKKIGLSLFPPLDQLPATALDFPLNYCITPEKIFSF